MHPKELSIADFTYDLPDDRIAHYPLAERDASKLLIRQNDVITEDLYANVANHLPQDTFLVFNNTKVVEARLLFQKPSGGVIEIFCLEPDERYGDITTAMLQKEKVIWKCLVGGAKKWKSEPLALTIDDEENNLILTATKIEKRSDYYLVELRWNDVSLSFAEILSVAGVIPLPPYMQRKAEDADKERYQTIYAQHNGSVAAPTAGLHFTQKVFDSFKQKNISHGFVTLHVGAGTFKPVKAEQMQDHEMHAEFIDVSRGFIEELIDRKRHSKIVAVGTTSLRTIESLYWMGRKINAAGSITQDQLHLSQWEAYENGNEDVDTVTALQNLLQWMNDHHLDRLLSKTQIIIAPGYRFRVIDGLITNFHQPQSTLLLIVAAIAGNDWRNIYDYALQHHFRFLSYGDGCLLWS